MRFATAAILVAAFGAGVCGCSSSSGNAAPNTTAAAPSSAAATTVAGSGTTPAPGPGTVPVAAVTASTAPSSTTSPSPSTAAATVAPSPTGVPGIAATDAFCAAWSRYSGTVQIIAVAVNFAELSSVQSATLELEAAPTVSEAVGQIDQDWPAELAAERSAAVDAYLGPYARRAAKAVDALRGAGMTDAVIAQVRDAWSHVLATRNPDEPGVDVQLPAAVAAQVDAGATAFDAAVTPWGADPSLGVDLDTIPKTKLYLAQHCPDLASIGVGDDV